MADVAAFGEGQVKKLVTVATASRVSFAHQAFLVHLTRHCAESAKELHSLEILATPTTHAGVLFSVQEASASPAVCLGHRVSNSDTVWSVQDVKQTFVGRRFALGWGMLATRFDAALTRVNASVVFARKPRGSMNHANRRLAVCLVTVTKFVGPSRRLASHARQTLNAP